MIFLLVFGTWINRDFPPGTRRPSSARRISTDAENRGTERYINALDLQNGDSWSSSPSLLPGKEPKWKDENDWDFWMDERGSDVEYETI